MAAFTHYWKPLENVERIGQPLQHIANDNTAGRGVEVGSTVFCVCCKDGKPFLVARMKIDRITTDLEEVDAFLGRRSNFRERSDHCLCSKEHGSIVDFEREIPLDIARRLRFSSVRDRLKWQDDERIDGQTLRTMRQLTEESTDLLNRLIDGG